MAVRESGAGDRDDEGLRFRGLMQRFGCGGGGDVELGLRLGRPPPPPEERKSITIFYDGLVCTVDVTELQARAIISRANQELEESKEEEYSSCSKKSMARRDAAGEQMLVVQRAALPASPQGLPAPPSPPPPPPPLNSGLSMKRSLQRFLQKRKMRIAAAAAAPYANHRSHPFIKS